MNYDQINVKFVSPEIGDLEIFEEKLKVINKSGIFSNNGPVSIELQALISQRWSNNNISLTSSATVGLLAVLCKLKNERDYNSEAFSKRNKIAVCGYGWPSSVQCPQILGFDIELFDTLADQPIFDWSEFLPMLNKEFLAVIVTNTFGLPSFNDSHVEMLKGLNIKLICDAAHCFGIDNLFSADQITADYYIVSTHATKVFQTAEGGIIISNSMQDKLLLDRLVNFNLDNPKDAYALNGKMSELGAALGISQLGKIDNIIKQRIQNVEKIYDAILKHGQSKWLKILDKLLALETWNGCYFPISFETRQERDKSFEAMRKNGVQAHNYFDFTLVKFCNSKKSLPNSSAFADTLCCLPIHHKLSDNDIKLILSSLLSS